MSFQTVISIRRLSKFLSCPEHRSECKQPSHRESSIPDPPSCLSKDQIAADCDPRAIVFQDTCCVWASSNEEEYRMILSRITLNLPRGLLIAIIGEVIIFNLFTKSSFTIKFKSKYTVFSNRSNLRIRVLVF